MDYTTKAIILLALVSTQVNGDCGLRNSGRYPCEGELECIYNFRSATDLITNWSCRRREVYDYNYGYRRTRLDEDYKLYVTATQIDGTNTFDAFSVINDLKEHIITLSITDGKMNSVPAAIYNLQKATTVDLSQNTLESLKLEAFSKMTSLKKLNVSINKITDLEVDERSSNSFSPVISIDLSYNAIQSIPNNYFRQFSELLYLDLSHNYIKSFDILTFEGIIQLKTLKISDNEITKLGVYFARFAFLTELYLDYNYLTSIEASNFDKMTKLEKLNISCNNLKTIEDTAFKQLIELKELDLSNNTINVITKPLLQNNNNLQSLDISSNSISKIEPGVFEGKHIQEFKIYNNPIAGSLLKNTFQGILVDDLDLSGGNITELGQDLFEGQLLSLNFSRNSISKIHKMAFNNLELLENLDLSYNLLQDIEFDTSNLKNLSHLYISHNGIKKITKDMFKALTSLKMVDLSSNAIEDIEILSFENLHELELLVLNNNPLMNVIPAQMFSGLSLSRELDFTNTKINTIQNNALSGMGSLKTFNSSHSNLMVLESNAFNGTGSIEILDLSYNQIETFSLDNMNLKLLKDLYLDHNKLQHVTDKTFSGLTDLRSLTINNNNLISIEHGAFCGLKSLLKIDLSGNKDMVFNSTVFSELQSLSVVLLNSVTSTFNFEDVVNSSISALDMSSCDISDINGVQVYQIYTLERLKLDSNKIRTIDKTSFQNLRELSWIDLSHNRLSSIQPGSFRDNEDLSVIDLSNNFISSLQFGVFDGLVNLNTIDLSSNTLHSFSASLFHNTDRVQVIYVDNNLIDDIDFDEFSKTNITELYIGGNSIPCSSLTNFKKNTDITIELSVKAKQKIFDIENVDGITCKSNAKFDNISQLHGNETALTAILAGTMEEFRVTVERFLNRNESKLEIDSTGFRNVSTSIDKFLEVFNKTENTNNAFLEKLMSINNSTNRALENIQEYIKVRNTVAVDSDTANDESKLNNDNVEKAMIALLAKEKQSLKDEFKSMFDDWKSQNAGSNKFEAQSASTEGSTDLKSALYFIATCLAALLCLIVLTLIFVFYKLRNRPVYKNILSHSRQPISNSMEME